jgi:hypothetical protein
MSILYEVELEGFAKGYYCIQPYYCERGFEGHIVPLPDGCREPYLKAYRLLRHKESGTIRDKHWPWVIVVFGSDPAAIRKRTLHEIVPLAKALYQDTKTRTLFIERLYAETKLPG